MTALKINPHLTRDAAHERLAQTQIGQAHLAGTGPKDTACFACASYGNDAPGDVTYNGHYKRAQNPGRMQDAFCHLMEDHPGKAFKTFAPDTPSCAFFERAKAPRQLVQADPKAKP